MHIGRSVGKQVVKWVCNRSDSRKSLWPVPARTQTCRCRPPSQTSVRHPPAAPSKASRPSAQPRGVHAMPTPEMSTFMKVLAAVLDFITIFMAGGFVIARL